MRPPAAVTFLLFLFQVAICQWPSAGGNAQYTGVVLSAIGNGKILEGNAYSVNNDRLYSALIMSSEGNFYSVGSTYLYCFNGTGSVNWKYPTEGGATWLALSKDENAIYYSTNVENGYNGAVNAKTGKFLWSSQGTGRGGVTVGPVTGNVFFAGTDKGGNCTLFTFSSDGKLLWQHTEFIYDGNCDTNGAAIDANEKYVVKAFGIRRNTSKLIAFKSATGEVLWSRMLDNCTGLSSPISIESSNKAFIGDFPNNFRIFDLDNNGTQIFQGAAYATGGFSLYQTGGKDYYLYCSKELFGPKQTAALRIINADGTPALWDTLQLPGATSTSCFLPVVTKDNYAVVLFSGNTVQVLYAVDLATGKVYWEMEAVFMYKSSALVGPDGKVYMVDMSGVGNTAGDLIVVDIKKTTNAPTTPAPTVPTTPTKAPTRRPTAPPLPPGPVPEWVIPTVATLGAVCFILVIVVVYACVKLQRQSAEQQSLLGLQRH